MIVLCVFIMLYEYIDVISVGTASARNGLRNTYYMTCRKQLPEDYLLAGRTQTNQVEQMLPLLVCSVSFASFVAPKAAAVLTALWVAIRVGYGNRMRSSAGETWKERGIHRFTIPCYFILGAMSFGTIVHIVRTLYL